MPPSVSGCGAFYLVSPTNISVLSHTSIETKIHHLMMLLSTHPEIEIVCTDSQECFDDNKAFLLGRLQEEQNPQVRKLLRKDVDFLDRAQAEMSTARQFLFVLRCKNMKPEQVFTVANAVEKTVSEHPDSRDQYRHLPQRPAGHRSYE